MLTLLWTLKSFKRTALFFPSVIGLLILVRLFALPKMFTPKVRCMRLRPALTSRSYIHADPDVWLVKRIFLMFEI